MLNKILSTLCALCLFTNIYSMQQPTFETLPLELKLHILQYTVDPVASPKVFQTVKNVMCTSKEMHSELANSERVNCLLIKEFGRIQDYTRKASTIIAASYVSTKCAQALLKYSFERIPEDMVEVLYIWLESSKKPFNDLLGNSEIYFMLNALNASAADYEPNSNTTFLMMAAHFNHIPTLKLLLDAGAKINQRDSNGKTALFYCLGNPKTVKFLLDRQANPNLYDKNGRTALMHAAALGNTHVAKLLLNAKADINQFGYERNNFAALNWAIINNKYETAEFLIDNGALVSACCGLLDCLIENNHKKGIEFLLYHARALDFLKRSYTCLNLPSIRTLILMARDKGFEDLVNLLKNYKRQLILVEKQSGKSTCVIN